MTDLPIITWLCIAFVCVFVTMTVILNVRARKALKRRASERQGESFETFLAACDPSVDVPIARLVYEEFERILDGRFPLRPGDNIVDDHLIDREDGDYLVPDLFRKARKQLPKKFGKDVLTLGDLALLLQQSPPI